MILPFSVFEDSIKQIIKNIKRLPNDQIPSYEVKFEAYPNPTRDSFKLPFKQPVNLILFNSLGHTVLTQIVQPNEAVEICHLLPGHYQIHIRERRGSDIIINIQKE